MNHKKTILSALLTLGAIFTAQAQSRCIASPYPVEVKQPDGSIITVIGRGHIDVNYAETVDGYTVVLNKSGVYEYANPATDGGFTPSGVKAHDPSTRNNAEKVYLGAQTLHLRFSPEKVQAMLNNASAAAKDLNGVSGGQSEDKGITVSGSFPQQGKRKILVILIQYPDLKSKYAASNFGNLMNQSSYKGIGSFHDYYFKNSFGKLDLDADVFGWYTADSGYAYYANSEGKTRARQLVANAVDSAEKSGVDFSKYDNDKDGYVDGVVVIHAGPGAEEGSQNQYVWSHRWVLGGSTARKYNGVTISDYAIQPESRANGSRMVGIGVLCHEFGHLLGLPDLYDVNYQSEGVGNWSLMAGGCWLDLENTPANFDAWSRTALGWIQPKLIDEAGFYTLKPSSTDSLIYKVTTPVQHEYFLLENRQLKGFDKKLDGKGMAIWHVNDSVLNKTLGTNTVNANENLKGVDLEEADGLEGLNNLNNRGDAGDLFPGSKGNTGFDDESTPNARNYNGAASGIRIFAITTLADSSIKFGFGALPQAVFNASVTSICQNQVIQFTNKSKFASGYSWSFGDGSGADTTYSPSHIFTSAGQFYVKLTAFDNGNSTFDSVKITVNPKAIADFDWSANGKAVTFTNKTQNGKSYFWRWGDGKVGYNATASFVRNYADTGTFTVQLIVTAAGNCNDTIEKTIHLTEPPAAVSETGHSIGLRVYPNPAGEFTTIQFTAGSSSQAQLSLVNSLGQEVSRKEKFVVTSGINTIPIPMADIRPGIYFVKLILDGKAYYVSVARK
jgi:M6 family metalloprotease-like protein